MGKDFPIPKNIKIDYKESNNFSTALITGAFGGVMGNGLINVYFYTDKIGLPTSTQIDVKGSDKGDERRQPIKFVREVPLCAMMDVNTAKSINSWLSEKIKEAEKITGNEK